MNLLQSVNFIYIRCCQLWLHFLNFPLQFHILFVSLIFFYTFLLHIDQILMKPELKSNMCVTFKSDNMNYTLIIPVQYTVQDKALFRKRVNNLFKIINICNTYETSTLMI